MNPTIALTCYLIGSIPLAWLVTWLFTGRDLRRLGSGNVGVMNTAISAGRLPGLMVFAGELGKGALAVGVARTWGQGPADVAVGVVAAVIGSRYSVWLKGAGGRANSCGAGALLCISGPALAAGLGLWVGLRLLTHSSYVTTRVTLASFPLLVGLISGSLVFGLASLVIVGMYLLAQQRDTDDHLIVRRRWGGLGGFLLGRSEV